MKKDINDMSLEEAIAKIHRDSPYPESARMAEMDLREADAMNRIVHKAILISLLSGFAGLALGATALFLGRWLANF